VLGRFAADVIVREQAELGAWMASERHGVPCVVHGVNVPWTRDFLRTVQAQIDDRLARHGLAPDPELHGLFGDVFLDVVPPGFRPPGMRPPPGAHPLRPGGFDRSGGEGLPRWITARDGRPLVYATLGTVFNRTMPVFEAILEALRDAPFDLLLTVGRNVDPGELGGQPDHVRVERYVPQSLALPYCDAVITHGGFNTTMAGLAHGLPLCFVPLGGDQGLNAARCVQLGAGLSCAPEGGHQSANTVDPGRLDPDALRAAMRLVLEEDEFRARARRLRAEIEAMPGPDQACRLVERLVA
jgi:UDP:flavonoid glycosyltransferase YjiC (YdhE family)